MRGLTLSLITLQVKFGYVMYAKHLESMCTQPAQGV